MRLRRARHQRLLLLEGVRHDGLASGVRVCSPAYRRNGLSTSFAVGDGHVAQREREGGGLRGASARALSFFFFFFFLESPSSAAAAMSDASFTALAPEVRSTVTDDARFPTRYVSFPAALAPEMLKVQDTIAICPSIASQKVGRSRRPVAGARTRADRCSLPTKGRPRRPRRRPRLGVAARCGARGAEGARPRRPRAARRWRGAGRLRRPLPRGAATFSRADSHELSVK